MITKEELDFLRESNNIEDEWDDLSLQDALLAWQYIKDQKALTVPVILETHRLLMKSRDTIDDPDKGRFRDGPVWIGGHEGKKWFAIPDLIESWIKDTETSIKIPGEDGKHIKLDHITYEGIHPFFDGNGRTGRIFLNWERLQAGLPMLVIKEKEKQKYYEWFK